MYSDDDGVIRRNGRKICNFRLRVTRYEESTDTLHGTLTLDGVTRRFEVTADGYRDDRELTAALVTADRRVSFFRPIGDIRAALDVLAFP